MFMFEKGGLKYVNNFFFFLPLLPLQASKVMFSHVWDAEFGVIRFNWQFFSFFSSEAFGQWVYRKAKWASWAERH